MMKTIKTIKAETNEKEKLCFLLDIGRAYIRLKIAEKRIELLKKENTKFATEEILGEVASFTDKDICTVERKLLSFNNF